MPSNATPWPLSRPGIGARISLLVLLWFFPASALLAQELGESVSRSGTVNEDLYLAGGNVNLAVTAAGDVVAAGGTVSVGSEVQGDVIVAGGVVTLRGRLRDDVRAAGGTITLDAEVGDDVLLAGGNVSLASATRIGGRAWLAGRHVEVAGRIGKELRAAGARVVIAGEVMGDARLAGEDIEIRPDAVIHGNLRYMSPKPAIIDEAARIEGTVSHLPAARHEPGAGRAFAGIGVLVSLIVTGAVLLWLFPRFAAGVAARVTQAPWRSLALGLAVLAATPLVILVLFVTVLGLWLGFLLLAAYLIALLAGFLAGALAAGETGFERLRGGTLSRGGRVAALVIALVVIAVLQWVPVLGGLVTFAVLLFGLGGLAWQFYRVAFPQSASPG